MGGRPRHKRRRRPAAQNTPQQPRRLKAGSRGRCRAGPIRRNASTPMTIANGIPE